MPEARLDECLQWSHLSSGHTGANRSVDFFRECFYSSLTLTELTGWTSARPEGTQPLPSTNSRGPDGRVCARRVPSPYQLRTAAVRMDE